MANNVSLGASRDDPAVVISFQVSSATGLYLPADGSVGFTEVNGLKSSTAIIDYKEGIEVFARKLLGRTTVGTITCKRGFDKKGQLREWYDLCREDNVQSPSLQLRDDLLFTVTARGTGLLASSVNIMVKYIGKGMWPSSLEISDLKDADEVLLQTVEFACEQLYEYRT